MKNIKFKRNIKKAILLICFFTLGINLIAQDDAVYTVNLELKTLKCTDDTRLLKVLLTADGEESTFPITKAEIAFYNLDGEAKILIGKALTDKTGKIEYTIPKEFVAKRATEGAMTFTAEFIGSDKLDPAEASVTVTDVKLQMKLTEEDSVKTITLSAFSIGEKGEEIAVDQTDVVFFIDGMFSRLKIGEGFFEAGECTFEFPKDLRGDHNGNLKVYAMFVEHEKFGDVEKLENAKWGTHRSNYTEPKRELWTTGAPIWMILTLSIMLIGVWSHYAYAVWQIFKVRKEGRVLSNKV